MRTTLVVIVILRKRNCSNYEHISTLSYSQHGKSTTFDVIVALYNAVRVKGQSWVQKYIVREHEVGIK